MVALRVKKEKFTIVIALFLYAFLLHIIYFFIISKFYAYNGFENSVTLNHVIISFLVIGVFLTIHLFNKTHPFIYSYCTLILVFQIIPSAILIFYFEQIDFRIIISHMLYYLSVAIIGNNLKIKIKSIYIKEAQKTYVLLYISIILIIPFVIVYLPYINLKNLFLIDIYVTRFAHAKLSNTYLSYSYSWISKVILPLLFVMTITNKKWHLTIFVLFEIIFLFLCGAHKTVLFGIVIMLVFYFKDYITKIKFFVYAIISILTLEIIFYFVFGNFYVTSLISRRSILFPSLLDIYYFDFFDDNYLFWSDSILKKFITYPYHTDVPRVLGKIVFHSDKMGANNGIVSEGFSQWGMIGVGLNILIVSLILSILKHISFSSRYFGLIFMMFFTFLSSALFTSLLTHGIVLLVILSLIFLKNSAVKNP